MIATTQGELLLPLVLDGVSSSSQILNPPLQVYCCSLDRQIVPYAPAPQPTPNSAKVLPSKPSPPSLSCDLPIASQKDTRTCTQHQVSNYVSLHRLSPSFCCFASALSSIVVPSSLQLALTSPGWKLAMDEKIKALHDNHT